MEYEADTARSLGKTTSYSEATSVQLSPLKDCILAYCLRKWSRVDIQCRKIGRLFLDRTVLRGCSKAFTNKEVSMLQYWKLLTVIVEPLISVAVFMRFTPSEFWILESFPDLI